MSHEKKRRDSELSLLLRLPPKAGTFRQRGGRVSCTRMIPIFQSFSKL